MISKISLISQCLLPTEFGEMDLFGFKDFESGKEIIAIGKIDKSSSESLFVRIHSKCLTSEVFGSLKCDCKDQLNMAMELIQEKKNGIIIYLDQEGRGIGLLEKIKAYNLQDQGQDTIEANISLGHKDDLRKYDKAIEVLNFFKISNINLNTNNPLKIAAFDHSNIKINKVLPSIAPINKFNKNYLKIKKIKCQHLL